MTDVQSDSVSIWISGGWLMVTGEICFPVHDLGLKSKGKARALGT